MVASTGGISLELLKTAPSPGTVARSGTHRVRRWRRPIGGAAAGAKAQRGAQAQRARWAYSWGAAGRPAPAGKGGVTGDPAFISPSDPAYSFFEPLHRGQASESSAADSSWRGPYNQLGHDSQ